jgi:Concanavalin A-like lectin/glucanases superfamily
MGIIFRGVKPSGTLRIFKTPNATWLGWEGTMNEHVLPYPTAAQGIVATDPNWANVVVLMHNDGTNGQTVPVDQKGHGILYTNSGTGGSLSNVQAKFGPTSLRQQQNASYWMLYGGTNDFTSFPGDFTIEMWNYAPTQSIDTYSYVVGIGGLVEDTSINFGCLNASGWTWGWRVFPSNGGSLSTNLVLSTGETSLWPLNVWHHNALVRSGDTITWYIDGVARKSAVRAGLMTFGTNQIKIGPLGGVSPIMFTDEFRITKGVARYTANFTPPTAAFPDS